MTVTHDEVRRVLGELTDHMVAEIVASGATESDLEEVAVHLAQENDVMGELERPLTGRALRIYTMIRRSEEGWDEDRP